MRKFTFWSVLHKNSNVALTEDFSRYARGETFWRALRSLVESFQEWPSSASIEETDFEARVQMYQETGINKVEIFIKKEGDRYAIKCANSRCLIEAEGERQALEKYIEARAKTSSINTGDPTKI